MNNKDRKLQADRILYEFGLFKKIEEIGNAHIIGSYRMDMMAWNDLDIDVENDAMSLGRLYELTAFITKIFHPLWYEAKEEVDTAGKRAWFHGFETTITGELWNIDLWFFDKAAISKAESYCDNIVRNTSQAQKEVIMDIKRGLIKRGIYSFEQYKSIDVYKAVMENGVKNIHEFLTLFS
ncbi:MAG: hypothetical protein K2O18_06945 [Oscillospiraceae bacterium]|nr:hypothetical protein [Oscillospiraceae bacterium]